MTGYGGADSWLHPHLGAVPRDFPNVRDDDEDDEEEEENCNDDADAHGDDSEDEERLRQGVSHKEYSLVKKIALISLKPNLLFQLFLRQNPLRLAG